MSGCCENKSHEIVQMRSKHSDVLWLVLILNITMFFVEGIFGLLAHSSSLLADSLDMFGDAIVYAFSLFVLTRSTQLQTVAALSKGIFMLVFGLGVLALAIYKFFYSVMPEVKMMGAIGVIALMVNLVCFYMLSKHRDDNLNMNSTWLCSRNDLIANIGVIFAAVLCHFLGTRLPDIFVALVIVVFFLRSAFSVLNESAVTLRGIKD